LVEAAVACVASAAIKADEPAVHALATSSHVPARFLEADALAAEEARLATQSAYVKSVVGAGRVAEAASLAASGADGALLVPKRVGSARHRGGRARGRRDRSGAGRPAARQAHRRRQRPRPRRLAHARGGGGDRPRRGRRRLPALLDLLGPALAGKRCHARALGEETERARIALSLAAEGVRWRWCPPATQESTGSRRWSSSCSPRRENPPGGRRDRGRARRLGAAAAAARAGAPLGHDFCAISLSDLLTPWSAIERRLVAAADADFAIALFNPASERRREPLARALAILRARREADKPPSCWRAISGARARASPPPTLAALDAAAIDIADSW
jgi:cobalt-precorrin 5A hydrolase/precorrin-3B C17-methyltransferase